MRSPIRTRALFSACLVAVLVTGRTALPQERRPAPKGPAVKQVAIGRNVFVEVEGKNVVRVVVRAHVCLRQAPLEHLLTRRLGKEHEAILAADIDARSLHTALLLAGAVEGKPVVLRRNMELPPSGTAVKITLAYKDREGKQVKVPAQQWVRHTRTKKDLQHDWVFVGSRFLVAPDDPAHVHYLANDGDVICVANFEAALLDLPVLSSAAASDLKYEAHTERIPPEGTPVRVILEPVRAKKQ
jgi:hypothetical protein